MRSFLQIKNSSIRNLLVLLLVLSVSFFPTSVYLATSIIVFLCTIFLANPNKLNNSFKLYLIFLLCGFLSVFQTAYQSGFLSVLGLVYILPSLGGFCIYFLLNGITFRKYKIIIFIIYTIAIIAAINALFFPQIYSALGNVNTEFLKFKRNSLYSDVESTALALGITFLFLSQIKINQYIIHPIIDYLLVLFIVLSTVSKSIIPFFPFLLFLIMGFKSRKSIFLTIGLAVILFLIVWNILNPLIEYFSNNGLSSFSGRIDKWDHILSEKQSFGDFLLGGGLRYINILGPYAGPHSLFVGLFAELGWLSLPALVCLVFCLYDAFGSGLIGLVAVVFFLLSGISSEVISNKFFLVCLFLIISLKLRNSRRVK